MKVNTQKLFCLLLSVLMVLSFTACGNGDSSAANGEEILPTEAAETAEPTQVPQTDINESGEADSAESDENGEVAQEASSESSEDEGYEYDEAIEMYLLAKIKMGKPGSIYSDVVAGIDHSSVTTLEGDESVTFFSSVMSDGAVVRFEGKNIEITEKGIVMNPGSTVTSLDAVGKIYTYNADILNKNMLRVSDQMLDVGYAYTFSSEKTSVERASEIHTQTVGSQPACTWFEENPISVAYYEPNFIRFEAPNYNAMAITVTSLTVGYNTNEKVTAITKMKLSTDFYGYYMEGEPYNYVKETRANEEELIFDFYLTLKTETMDSLGLKDSLDHYWVWFIPEEFYTTGDLKDADGNVVDKETARVYEGYTLDVTVGEYTFAVELPMAERFEGAQTMKELRPYSTQTAVGQQNVLVVPIVWADKTDMATSAVYSLYQKALGSIIDQYGNPVQDYSNPNDKVFSLSEYYDTASYGQLKISSFMTDWFYSDKNFDWDYEYIFPEVEFGDEVLQWVKANYPDIDWTKFDQDGDGYVDAIVFFSVGLPLSDSYSPASFAGAVHTTGTRFSDRAGTPEDPQVNCFLTVSHLLMQDGDANTLIHEFGHNLGLKDYYDISYTGISPLGGFDILDSNRGDWNSYSKLAVGWMNPQVVTNLASGESVEFTIGSSALVGDVIILPAAGTEYEGPFGEYVMIDLFSDDGTNAFDAGIWGLSNTTGVRITHVNATMRCDTENNETIGMELFGNYYVEGNRGFYNVELIQAGKVNTLTNLASLNTLVSPNDFFYEGDTFTAEEYTEFFYEGLMDNGMPLGYTVRILSIGSDADGNPTATIQITAN